MVYQSLYRTWRPQTFDEIAGQPHVTQTLKNAIEQGRVSHAYLFSGPRGTGKTTTARILAKAINCEKGPTATPCGVCDSCVAITDGTSMDVLELDAASNRKVEEIREFLEKIPYSAAQGCKKVYIIDEVHMLTTESFNTLLKTLEEPPEHVIFILATTEPHKVLPTIMSRCQRFDFRRIALPDIVARLRIVADAEKIPVDDAALAVIADHVQGAMRDALGILEQLAVFSKESIGASDVNELLGLSDTEQLFTFTGIIAGGDLGAGLVFIEELVSSGGDVRQFIFDSLQYLRNLYLVQAVPAMRPGAIPDTLWDRFIEQSKQIHQNSLTFYITTLNDVYNQSRWSNDIRLMLEIALFKMIKTSDDTSLEGLMHRVERLESALVDMNRGDIASPVPSVSKTAQTKPVAPKSIKKNAAAPTLAAPETSGTSEALTAEPGFEQITAVWPQVLKIIKEKKKTRYSFFAAAKPVRIENGRLVLLLKAHEKIFVESPENLQLVRSAIKVAGGFDIPVSCELEREPMNTVAVREGENPDEALEVDDYVKLVQDAFGAKIIEEITTQED